MTMWFPIFSLSNTFLFYDFSASCLSHEVFSLDLKFSSLSLFLSPQLILLNDYNKACGFSSTHSVVLALHIFNFVSLLLSFMNLLYLQYKSSFFTINTFSAVLVITDENVSNQSCCISHYDRRINIKLYAKTGTAQEAREVWVTKKRRQRIRYTLCFTTQSSYFIFIW